MQNTPNAHPLEDLVDRVLSDEQQELAGMKNQPIPTPEAKPLQPMPPQNTTTTPAHVASQPVHNPTENASQITSNIPGPRTPVDAVNPRTPVDAVNPRIPIGKAAEMIGVSIDTLRRWDKSGKVKSRRSPGGHRYFTQEDLNKVFGTRYERTTETKIPANQPTAAAQSGQVATSEPRLAQTTQQETKPSYVTVEEVEVQNDLQTQIETPTESALSEKQEQVEIKNILEPTNGLIMPEPAKSGFVATLENVGVAAIVVFAIADAILAFLYFTSNNLLSPLQ